MKRLTKKLCAALSVLLLLIPMAFADEAAPTLLYMGQASIRIVTAEGKVIYIDPYAGNQYDLPADLILVTHEHFDHSAVDRVTHRNDACQMGTLYSCRCRMRIRGHIMTTSAGSKEVQSIWSVWIDAV
jgi:hypothetical protein